MMEYVKNLPTLNLSNKFLIVESAFSSFTEDWLDFQDLHISSFSKSLTDKRLQGLQDYKKGTKAFLLLDPSIQELVGLNANFLVLESLFDNQTYKFINKMNYLELIELYTSGEKLKLRNGYSINSIIDKFLIYQWSNGKLLFPMGINLNSFQRKKGWEKFVVQNNTFLEQCNIRLKNKESSHASSSARYNYLSYVITATTWRNILQIDELSLVQVKDFLTSKYQNNVKRKAMLTLAINDVRYLLIDKGRDDITHPKKIKKQQKELHEVNYTRFDWIDEKLYPNLSRIREDIKKYCQSLRTEGIKLKSIDSKLTALNHFCKYFFEYYKNSYLSEKVVNRIYDVNDSTSFHFYLKQIKRLTRDRQVNIFRETSRFLDFLGVYTQFAQNHTPKYLFNNKTSPRNAMPREMLNHLIDIVKNRPPKKDIYWDKKKASLGWWKHKDVYPVFPLMALLHYYIPLRGAQIRNLCRDISFRVNPVSQRIDSIIVNTDKNVNRKELQEIPCVWDDLQIFKDFIKWHTEYFPYLPKVKYDNDENSAFKEFTPLMIVDGSNQPMNQQTYFIYHKRILCQYQIEMNEKYRLNEIDYCPKVAWLKDKNKSFFESINDLNSSPDNYININVEVAYDVHSIRVTGITRYLDAGLGLHLIALLSGHTDLNTIIRVYTKLTKEEQMKKLKSSINGLFFGEKETLEQNVKEFVFDELSSNVPTTTNKQYTNKIENLVEDNALFSLHRRDTFSNKHSESFEIGTDIAKKVHPSLWQTHIFGICPSVLCESGRERKCSLCPYLITGKLFMHGVIHQTNLTFARFYRLNKEIQDEKQKGYNSHAKAQELETIMEEILGWSEILNKIEKDMKSLNLNNQLSSQKALFTYDAQDETIAYLKNAYDAKALGVEQDYFGLKVLTIKATKLLAEKGEFGKCLTFLDSNEKSIDFLLSYYKKSDDISLIGDISKWIEK